MSSPAAGRCTARNTPQQRDAPRHPSAEGCTPTPSLPHFLAPGLPSSGIIQLSARPSPPAALSLSRRGPCDIHCGGSPGAGSGCARGLAGELRGQDGPVGAPSPLPGAEGAVPAAVGALSLSTAARTKLYRRCRDRRRWRSRTAPAPTGLVPAGPWASQREISFSAALTAPEPARTAAPFPGLTVRGKGGLRFLNVKSN